MPLAVHDWFVQDLDLTIIFADLPSEADFFLLFCRLILCTRQKRRQYQGRRFSICDAARDGRRVSVDAKAQRPVDRAIAAQKFRASSTQFTTTMRFMTKNRRTQIGAHRQPRVGHRVCVSYVSAEHDGYFTLTGKAFINDDCGREMAGHACAHGIAVIFIFLWALP